MPQGRPTPGRGLAAALLLAMPLAARLGWWWWRQGRRPVPAPASIANRTPATVERTEVELVRRWLGRWRVQVVSTSWQFPADAVASAGSGPSLGRRGWVASLLRLAELAVESSGHRKVPPGQELPRLPAPPGRLRA